MNSCDFLSNLGSFALGSRLRRLSDSFLSEVEIWYRNQGIEISPRCVPVMLFLSQYDSVPIKDIATGLHLTHSGVSQLITILQKIKYVDSIAAPSDARARKITLTKKGRAFIERSHHLRKVVSDSVAELLHKISSQILKEIEKLEEALSRESFGERILRFDKNDEYTFEPFTKPYLKQVQKLIISIQQKEFEIPITLADQTDIQDPCSFFNVKGGQFWIARTQNRVIGTIGIIRTEDNHGVIRKMFVDKQFRGKQFGIGQKLLEQAFQFAKENKCKKVILGTTAPMLRAQSFYEKHGFKRIDPKKLPKSFPRMAVDTVFYEIAVKTFSPLLDYPDNY